MKLTLPDYQQADVLVLDEPLVNLDYKLREALVLELKALLSETQATVIIPVVIRAMLSPSAIRFCCWKRIESCRRAHR